MSIVFGSAEAAKIVERDRIRARFRERVAESEEDIKPGMSKYEITAAVPYFRTQRYYVWAVDDEAALEWFEDDPLREPDEADEYELGDMDDIDVENIEPVSVEVDE